MYALNFKYEHLFLAAFWISTFQYKVIENGRKLNDFNYEKKFIQLLIGAV